MKRKLAVAAATSVIAFCSAAAVAETLPAIKTSGTNKVPECATPGRLMAFLAQRNAKLDPRFAGLATAYMRHGEQLGVRWDYAIFQMILETGNLSYTRNGTKPGDVKPAQNNFAGLGATGKGESGESFSTIEDGVRAHLQHLVMYSGERVEGAVAERTRKVQEWGVLTAWHKGFKKPITFADLAAKWAPGSKGYASNVKSIGSDFYDDLCKKADPRPELVHEARSGRGTSTAKVARQDAADRPQGVELARKANERARSEGAGQRSTLGAKAVATAKAATSEPAASPSVKVLNDQAEETAQAPAATSPATTAAAPPTSQPPVKTASAAAAAKTAKAATAAPAATPAQTPPATTIAALPKTAPPTAQSAAKCRVYTASYGGQKAVIIRASADSYTNYTVLDVNEGQEAREIEAYVSAYAKGGHKVGEFSSPNAALDKAFQLCPEG